MAEYLLTVDDAFPIKDRGVVVTGMIPAEWLEVLPPRLRINRDVEVRLANGTVLRTKIAGIDCFPECFPTVPRRVGVGLLLSPGVTLHDTPRGATVYLGTPEPENTE